MGATADRGNKDESPAVPVSPKPQRMGMRAGGAEKAGREDLQDHSGGALP